MAHQGVRQYRTKHCPMTVVTIAHLCPHRVARLLIDCTARAAVGAILPISRLQKSLMRHGTNSAASREINRREPTPMAQAARIASMTGRTAEAKRSASIT